MFKQLKIYYVFVALPFVMLLIGAAIFAKGISYTLVRNPHPQINYTIFTIILVGGCLILLNARRLLREARVIVEFFGAVHDRMSWQGLRDLANRYTGETACLLQMVASSGGRHISHQEQAAIEHELTNTRSGLLRRNALPQYLTGLLVGMGLLGTFIGLLATLNDITILISSFADIDMQNASPLLVFRTMIERMKAPMSSMGIAFSASMFGLLGSIILGLMMVGIRRLQGDMFSVLSSEVARHIEIALGHESVTLSGGAVAATGGDAGEVAKVLIRIEERYAEAARAQQRALSTVIDEGQKQRTDVLRVLTEQTEASNSNRVELQNLGHQLGSILNTLEKSGGTMAEQVSDLTVQLAGNAGETQRLHTMQIEEQKKLKETLESYRIEERLAESTRVQQRSLSAVIDDFQQQRTDMLRVLSEQTEATQSSRGEMQQLGSRLEHICNAVEKGNQDVSSQVSELTVRLTADTRESQLRLETVNSTIRDELRQLCSQLENSSSLMERGNDQLGAKLSALIDRIAAESVGTQERIDKTTGALREELQQLGRQLDNNFNLMGQGNGEICARLTELITGIADHSHKSVEQLDLAGEKLLDELHALGLQLRELTRIMASPVEDAEVLETEGLEERNERQDD